ncbi:MAG: hypothetical protein N3I35_02125 [Clostridia bacterium]|nr:hypothetical protein [Clostridia bacterium]
MDGKTAKGITLMITTVLVLLVGITTYTIDENQGDAISHINDENVNIPEPKNNNVPSYAKWDARLGAYISEDVYYDEESKTYRDKPKYDKDYDKNEAYRNEKWLKGNKDSDKKLYKAIVNWNKNRTLSLSAFYIIKDDPVFKENILSLGFDYLPEMLDLAFNDRVWNLPMLAGVECMTGIQCLPEKETLDSSENRTNLWKEEFKEYLANAKDMVKDEKDIQKLGMFALPYISDEIENGDTRNVKHLSKILSKCSGIEKENWSDKETGDWKEWISKNGKKISTLKSIIKSFGGKQ